MRETAVPCQQLGCRLKSWRDDGLCPAHAKPADGRASVRLSAVPVAGGGHRDAHLYSHTPASLGALRRVHQIVARNPNGTQNRADFGRLAGHTP